MSFLLEALLVSAKEGGEILRCGFYSAKDIEFKGSVDLVTEFDKAVEACVVRRLSELLPELGIVGEEGSLINPHSSVTAYIDPIDGTTNFIHGVPHTAVSIGVWDGLRPVAGVVYNPILDELYFAEYGCGAYCNNSRIYVSKTNELIKSLVATGFPYTKYENRQDLDWVLARLERVLPSTRDVRRLGSASLDLCYTAKGVFDAYYEINLKPWDYAAGAIVLLEAGGRVCNEKQELINMREKLIIGTNSEIFDKFVATINQSL